LEALSITEQQGVQDGLAFLIGEKFSLVYYQLKTAHNKLKYLYPDSTPENSPILRGNKTLQLSYTLTVNENYRGILERVDLLQGILYQFIEEIKESFPSENIQDYLNSYPRLTFKGNSSPSNMASLDKSSQMIAEDIFSEVEDILIINEIKNLFT
jgi:hypothetical protein